MKKGRVFDMFSGNIREMKSTEKQLLQDDELNDYGDSPSRSFQDAFSGGDSGRKRIVSITSEDVANMPDVDFSKRRKLLNKERSVNEVLGLDESKIVRVFCDGSCFGNGKANAVAGIGVMFPDNKGPFVSAPYHGALLDISYETGNIVKELTERGQVTNQRAELTAVFISISLAAKVPGYVAKENVIQIYTDSEYSINTFTSFCHTWEENNWRKADSTRPKNLDIILPIWDLMKEHRVMFFHTRAHTGKTDAKSVHNDSADKLAKRASFAQKPKKEKK